MKSQNAMSRKRKVLSLEERVSVLKKVEEGKSCRAVSNELGVGKTQVQTIVKEREDILRRWESGERSNKKYVKPRTAGYDDLDKLVWEWFTTARAKNIPVSGRMIQEQARLYAAELGHEGFSGSNGWLDRWQKRHNVRMATLSGEAADVSESVIEDWSRRLESVCNGYQLRDIFNADETGLFYRALPTKSMSVKGEEAKGGRKSKERITVLLACSAEGEKLRPFVIGHSANPRCFKGLASLACLPVTYFSNKKAWMTAELFQQWLDKLNSKMKCEGRSILLLVDNCSAHPDIQFSNVKLVFLPPNTTSKLQPCDAGIIQATKMHYRKLLLRHVLFHMNEASCASDLAKSVNVLDAIMWLKSAWDNVKPTTIQKCFAKCGFTQAVFADPEEDNACTIDSSLGALVETCGASWEVYANFDQDLATNGSIDEDWEAVLLEKARSKSSSEDKVDINEDENEDEEEDETVDDKPILSAEAAISHLVDLRDFALSRQSPELLELISKSKNVVEKLMCDPHHLRQTKLSDFF